MHFREYTWSWRLDKRDPAQSQRLQSILTHWNAQSRGSTLPVYKEQRDLGNGVVDLVLYGYELTAQAPSPEALAKARQALARLSTPNVVLDFPRNSPSDEGPHSASSLINPERFFKLTSEPPNMGTEASLGCYLQRCLSWQPLMVDRLFTQRVRVIVLDYDVDSSHPELSAAVVEGDNPGPALPLPYPDGKKEKQLIALRDFEDEDHGTHLAGIVAARSNGYGVLGVNPGALIDPVVWLPYPGLSSNGTKSWANLSSLLDR